MEDNKTDAETIFFETIIPFSDIEDGQIETESFLKASKCIVEFVEMFGVTFRPVKNDIEGNINKLMKIFDSDKLTYKHLNSIVKIEKETLGDRFKIGTDALTWLNRALIYNQIFLSLFLDDYRKAESEEMIKNLNDDLTEHFSSAYELALKKYHGWFVQKIFSCCLMAVPSRQTLLQYLGYLNNKNLTAIELKNLIINSIGKYFQQLKSNTEAVSILLISQGVQP